LGLVGSSSCCGRLFDAAMTHPQEKQVLLT